MLFRIASAAALAASTSIAVAPLAAAELPRFAAPTGIAGDDSIKAQKHRRWRRDRVDAGDVIGGLLVIGTIAAVASAASKANRGDRDRDYRYDHRSRTHGSTWQEGRGLDRAVDMCAREVERSARIDTVDSANRTGDGWYVSGRLRTGGSFRCTIGNDGRIDAVDFGAGAYRGVAEDRQWDDDRYTAARAKHDAGLQPLPAYPGGPIGDETLSDVPADGSRYQTAQAPDFHR